MKTNRGISRDTMKNQTVIMHIDVNSAFLSWQAAYNLQHGDALDLRDVPSAVGGSQKDRNGIVLAKSIPAKALGIQTGQVIWQAKEKCPELVIVPPNYELYMMCSNALYQMVREYSPKVQRFSVDEMFMDYTGMSEHFGTPMEAAHNIKERIKKELGFTVNIGIGSNKLLAKMAGDLKKPDMVHVMLTKEDMKSKMWPLAVEDLFMVGRATKKKLKELNISTIGDLAKADTDILVYKFKSFGALIWQYANGIDKSMMKNGCSVPMKSIGNSTTIRFDVDNRQTAYKVLLSLTESVAARLRMVNCCCRVISVEIRSFELKFYTHQRKVFAPTNITIEIFEVVKELFDECWKGEKIRHLGVRVADLSSDEFTQSTIFDDELIEKRQNLDGAIDRIRGKFGKGALMRATFLDKEIKPMTGGVDVDEYPLMSGIL